MTLLRYNTVPKTENVLVIGGGPSACDGNIKKVLKLISPYPTIIRANNPRSPVDYVVVQHSKAYKDFRKKNSINATGIVGKEVDPRLYKGETLLFDYCLEQRVYSLKQIRFENEQFQHQVGNCGFTAIFASVYFRPKRLYIIGFDGPDSNNRTCRKAFGKTTTFSKGKQARLNEKRKFINSPLMWDFLISQGIRVHSFSLDPLWGISKKRFGIKDVKL